MVSSTIFKVFGKTRPGIEPRSPGPLANTLTAGPVLYLKCKLPYPGFELEFPCPFPTTVTITPRTPVVFVHVNTKLEREREREKERERERERERECVCVCVEEGTCWPGMFYLLFVCRVKEKERVNKRNEIFGLFCFYGISTIVGHLKPNYFLYIYITNIKFGLAGFYGISTIVGLYTQTVLFQTIQFSINLNVKNIFISSYSGYSTKLNGSKYCYVSLTIQLNISHLVIHS